jgi:hypothetical protein
VTDRDPLWTKLASPVPKTRRGRIAESVLTAALCAVVVGAFAVWMQPGTVGNPLAAGITTASVLIIAGIYTAITRARR